MRDEQLRATLIPEASSNLSSAADDLPSSFDARSVVELEPRDARTLLREILKSELSPRGHLVEGSEACYRYARTAGAFHVSALRSPRAHSRRCRLTKLRMATS